MSPTLGATRARSAGSDPPDLTFVQEGAESVPILQKVEAERGS